MLVALRSISSDAAQAAMRNARRGRHEHARHKRFDARANNHGAMRFTAGLCW